MTKQTQKGGDSSYNIQINIDGVTYAEACQIALDVFKDNFLKLSEHAAKEAKRRAEEITNKFLKKLERQNREGLRQATDPDFQYSLFNVQKEYARTGDKELGDLLVDLLVDRTKHDDRGILQIVLNESLLVAPKLTKDQLAALSVIFAAKYIIDFSVNDPKTFMEYLDNFFMRFSTQLSKNNSCYQHLEYAGCGSINIETVSWGPSTLSRIFRKNYSGIFSRGFHPDELKKRNINLTIDNYIFTECFHDNEAFQINGLNEKAIKEKAKESDIPDGELDKLLNLQREFTMSDKEMDDYIIENRSFMKNVFDVWNCSYLKDFNLTSVGIAIGHANIKRTLDEFTDLSIWIN